VQVLVLSFLYIATRTSTWGSTNTLWRIAFILVLTYLLICSLTKKTEINNICTKPAKRFPLTNCNAIQAEHNLCDCVWMNIPNTLADGLTRDGKISIGWQRTVPTARFQHVKCSYLASMRPLPQPTETWIKSPKSYYNKIMFIWTRSLSNAFRQFTIYVRINIISELFRPVEKKSNSLISNSTAAMIFPYFCNILTINTQRVRSRGGGGNADLKQKAGTRHQC